MKTATWCGVMFVLVPMFGSAASFDRDCAATNPERMMCVDPEQSKRDDELHRAYRDGLTELRGTQVLRGDQLARFASQRIETGPQTALQRQRHAADRLSDFARSDSALVLVSASDESPGNNACYRLFRGERFAMCREFERNLNQYCQAPPMLCNVQIATEFRKDFGFPAWETLDLDANMGMIEKFIRARVSVRSDWIGKPEEKNWRDKKWKKYEPELMQHIKEGVVQFSSARFDLNHDGKAELVYRLIDRECPVNDPTRYHFPTGPKLMVLDEAIGEFDFEYTKHLFRAYDVLLYEGRAYLSHFGAGDDRVITALQIYRTASSAAIGRFAVIGRPMCGYEYRENWEN